MLSLKNLIHNLVSKNQLLYITFIFILISINISPHFFFNYNFINSENEKIIDINFIINIVRFISPVILTLVLLIKIKNQIKINFFKNNIINIYILYFSFCILSALINFNDIKNNILELYFIIIIPVIFFLILLSNLNKKKIIFIYVLTILFISFVAILFLIPNFYYTDYILDLRNSPIYNPDLYLLGVNTIKSTGISRLLLVIYIFFFCKDSF